MGYQPNSVIEFAGLSPGDFESSENRVPYAEAVRLINAGAEVSCCLSFGLLLGECFTLQDLGLAGRLAHTSATVEVALHDLMENFHLHDSGGIIALDKSARIMSLGYRSLLPRAVSVVQVNDMCIACLFLIMRALCGEEWSPSRVQLSRPRPDNDALYRKFFRAPVIFGAKRNALSFSNHWLDRPTLSADLEGHMALTRIACEARNGADPGLSTLVRRYLHRGLHLGQNASGEIAEALGMHERTLRRRLQQEHISFSKLLEEVRQTTSFQYLSDTELSISDIAGELGYSSTDAFDHAFRRWHGLSPLQWRKRYTLRDQSVEPEH
jgi:AraC-like DNA-binding protein